MQKSGFFMKQYFAELLFKVSAWLSNHAVCKIGLKYSPKKSFSDFKNKQGELIIKYL